MSRIIYTTSEQETLDIDWFVCDSRGYIGHFASGGTMLPAFIADDRQTNEILHRYFTRCGTLAKRRSIPT